MPPRRILSAWFPHLATDLVLRHEPALAGEPLVVVESRGNARLVSDLSPEAAEAGIRVGMALGDAQVLYPPLASRMLDPLRLAAIQAGLRRWAGRFSPWVAEEGADALMLDITGCAHLFGGEAAMARRIAADCATLGFGVRTGIAGTAGAAWAIGRFGKGGTAHRSGDDIDQEARATRSRAARRRHWERGGTPPTLAGHPAEAPRIIPTGRIRSLLGPLPVAALRLEPDTCEGLNQLGLRHIDDLAGIPRAAIARRFGMAVMHRLDQAFGAEPEPISPARPAHCFAVRLTLPDPIGLHTDILAALDRLLPALATRLDAAGQGARRLRLTAFRADHGTSSIEIGLARPTALAAAIRPLLALKLDTIEIGFGIDTLRLEATQTEPIRPQQRDGHQQARTRAEPRRMPGGDDRLETLMNRLGTRIGIEAMARLAPSERHIPEKSAILQAAAFAPAVTDWPRPPQPRPIRLYPPEPLVAFTGDGAGDAPPRHFRWRRRTHQLTHAEGPERIAPEWWLDDPAWRSGTRDYWRVETAEGLRLWLFAAAGGEISGGWFVHGDFA